MTAEQWWALAGLGAIALACVVRRTKRLAALIAAHEAEWDEWVLRAPGFDEAPIYAATAAYIAAHEAAQLDDEWAQMNGGAR